MQFTQEIKDNWLASLKSGKYKQGFGGLIVDEEGIILHNNFQPSEIFHCCIGVLGDCTPHLSADPSGQNDSPYAFLERTIGAERTKELWQTNDDLEYRETGKRDYSNVIPLIENLPVESNN